MVGKWITMIIALIILISGVTFAESQGEIVDLNQGANYASESYHKMAMALVERYPEILKYVKLGASHDGNPIYALVMTSDIGNVHDRDDFIVLRRHYLVDAGIHARETVNPAIVLKMVETYAMDFYDDSVIGEFDVEALLQEGALHFIPLVNPDGHDLSKFGIASVKTPEIKSLLNGLKDKVYNNWKANARGVDLNRNFPDYYLNEETGVWTNNWKLYPNGYVSDLPGGSYYHGEPASELETQALMAYMDKYDFNSYISYHSRGRILYYSYPWHPKQVQDASTEMAKMVQSINGYAPVAGDYTGSGYSTNYFVSMTLKPAITIETVRTGTRTPTEQKYYLPSFEETHLIPLYNMERLKDEAYGDYKLYDSNGKYVRDFEDPNYARIQATLIGGEVIQYQGLPFVWASQRLTREGALMHLLTERMDLSELTLNATDRFNDSTSLFVTFAKNQGIVNGDYKGNFYPDRHVTVFEYANIIYKLDLYLEAVVDENFKEVDLDFMHPNWASDGLRYAIYQNLITENDLERRYIIR